jgi:hypothetical protein
MIRQVAKLLSDNTNVQLVQVDLTPEQKASLEKQFGLYLFSVLLPATDPLAFPHIQHARQLFENGSTLQRRRWKHKYKGKFSRLSWRILPYHAAMAALSTDDAALARFTEYTAKALVVHRSCKTSLKHARKALRHDSYHVWADFAAALAALVKAIVKV